MIRNVPPMSPQRTTREKRQRNGMGEYKLVMKCRSRLVINAGGLS